MSNININILVIRWNWLVDELHHTHVGMCKCTGRMHIRRCRDTSLHGNRIARNGASQRDVKDEQTENRALETETETACLQPDSPSSDAQ
jgi:hypothetical protein